MSVFPIEIPSRSQRKIKGIRILNFQNRKHIVCGANFNLKEVRKGEKKGMEIRWNKNYKIRQLIINTSIITQNLSKLNASDQKKNLQ